MVAEVTTYGLLHPTTKRFVRFVNSVDEVAIFHRMSADRKSTSYHNERDEINERSRILEMDELGPILELLATNEWSYWNEEPDIDDDFSDFIPVAIIRGKRRLGGVGDFYDIGMRVMKVILKDPEGKEFDLEEITAG